MITILGSTGMLGSMLKRVIKNSKAINRDELDARNPNFSMLFGNGNLINAMGLIKPYCGDVRAAIEVNALFPHYLPPGTIQIATDCVFDGTKTRYVETSLHDATDVYGKTKSLGEAPQLFNLRCSIIGPERKSKVSLLEWFLAQDRVDGYVDHYWNGITTYHFAKIAEAIIKNRLVLPNVQHIVPADIVTKAELLDIIAEVYKKRVIIVNKRTARVDRTLSTNNPGVNLMLWQAAGYKQPPTIYEMIKELQALRVS